MSLPALNVPLLRSLVTWAYADHEHDQNLLDLYSDWGSWGQGSWHETTVNPDGTCPIPDLGDPMRLSQCDSSYCIAGQAVAQVGYRLNLNPWETHYDDAGNEVVQNWRADSAQAVAFDGLDDKGFPTYKTVGEPEAISDVAKRALGLTSREGDALFEAGNEIDRIAGLALVFAAARGVNLRLREEIEALGVRDLEDKAQYYAGSGIVEVFGLTEYSADADAAYNEAVVASGLWPETVEPEPEEYRVLFSVYVNALEHEDPESLARDLVRDDVYNMQHVETESAGSYY